MTTEEMLRQTARSEALGAFVVDTFHDKASWEECQRDARADEGRMRQRLEEAEKEFASRVA